MRDIHVPHSAEWKTIVNDRFSQRRHRKMTVSIPPSPHETYTYVTAVRHRLASRMEFGVIRPIGKSYVYEMSLKKKLEENGVLNGFWFTSTIPLFEGIRNI